MKSILRTLAIWSAVIFPAALSAQTSAPEHTIEWEITHEKIDGKDAVVFTGQIAEGWHTYDADSELYPFSVEFTDIKGCSVSGEPYALSESRDYSGEKVFFDEVRFAVGIELESPDASVSGEISWMSCTETTCAAPEFKTFSVDFGSGAAGATSGGKSEDRGNLWALIIEAILWGFAALLTPCVFPMVPMTVSFFLKGSSTPAAGRFKAAMYGLFIVLLYTVPISLIILITRIVGGDAVTADIFNWLATHWLPNTIFFIVFMIFAASFFGAFEIVLPTSLVNKSDKKSDKGGLAGIFFMALTLVLVSFSCTGPIVGTVLIKSTEGEFWTPMITMLAFSVAFALPFTILALFPSLLTKLKSGSWMNTVKVVLGFIEVALGFKFLSVADQTYHWGLLDREVYLAIWIVTFSLLGLYLLGKIRFAHDTPCEHVSVKRLAAAIAVFSFVVYMIPGMFGAPLKALSGYLPPMTTQDFVLGSNVQNSVADASGQSSGNDSKYDLHLPLGLSGYFDLDEGLAAAAAAGKPVFVDITGHGCVNCREMESRVWSDPEVLEILSNDYIIVALYTDDKTKLDEEDWVTTENGDVLKEMGRANSYIVRTRFGVNAQPNYVLLSPDGKLLAPVRGYDLSVPGFIAFLQKGLAGYFQEAGL